jgi:hypothetical protein
MAAEPLPATPAASDTNRNVLTLLFVVYVVAIAVFCVYFHRVMFAWPAGIVTGNLLASAIWAPLAVVHLDRLARKHHREHMTVLHKHQSEVLKAVNNVSPGP